ncbi:unnamed protein product [Miscanthus lutarioriparius]|uniref:Myb/SANT-like domain-containing protein n=1 Tax=Miscanthus lutarioriparius TaxID=422564 RepID=A0A811QB70_9POAL|nr:unnamed protein product [Miscanthus lutarioriparius]
MTSFLAPKTPPSCLPKLRLKLLPPPPRVQVARRRQGWGCRGLLRRRRRPPPTSQGWLLATCCRLLAVPGRLLPHRADDCPTLGGHGRPANRRPGCHDPSHSQNKWDKLEADQTIWLKLKRRQIGTDWNNATKTIDMEIEWWKKARNDIFQGVASLGKSLSKMRICLGKCLEITNVEADHWNPISDNPIIPSTQEQPFDVDSEYGGGENIAQGDPFDANILGG